ncbi:hypothetical protein AC249_AIPGENE4859 [Exaiptasia diaphana]|nr:hypothetical protein AC249_AIPGENE4859 [Exaiptasia diaphana]
MATTLMQQDINDIDYEQPLRLEFKRIDGPWSWLLCFLFFLCNVLAYGFIATYGILFPNILKDFSSGRAITALDNENSNNCSSNSSFIDFQRRA